MDHVHPQTLQTEIGRELVDNWMTVQQFLDINKSAMHANEGGRMINLAAGKPTHIGYSLYAWNDEENNIGSIKASDGSDSRIDVPEGKYAALETGATCASLRARFDEINHENTDVYLHVRANQIKVEAFRCKSLWPKPLGFDSGSGWYLNSISRIMSDGGHVKLARRAKAGRAASSAAPTALPSTGGSSGTLSSNSALGDTFATGTRGNASEDEDDDESISASSEEDEGEGDGEGISASTPSTTAVEMEVDGDTPPSPSKRKLIDEKGTPEEKEQLVQINAKRTKAETERASAETERASADAEEAKLHSAVEARVAAEAAAKAAALHARAEFKKRLKGAAEVMSKDIDKTDRVGNTVDSKCENRTITAAVVDLFHKSQRFRDSINVPVMRFTGPGFTEVAGIWPGGKNDQVAGKSVQEPWHQSFHPKPDVVIVVVDPDNKRRALVCECKKDTSKASVTMARGQLLFDQEMEWPDDLMKDVEEITYVAVFPDDDSPDTDSFMKNSSICQMFWQHRIQCWFFDKQSAHARIRAYPSRPGANSALQKWLAPDGSVGPDDAAEPQSLSV